MNLILLGRGCGDGRDGCTVAGGVMESEIARIAVNDDSSLVYMEVRTRQIQGGGIFAKVEFVRYCVEYLYSSVTMRLYHLVSMPQKK
jgi:hypothetical protein